MAYLGQNLLNMMEVLDNELQLQPGEPDVARALVALNMSQHQFETLGAKYSGFRRMHSTGHNDITTETNPTQYLTPYYVKIDRIQPMTGTGVTATPAGPDLENLGYVGYASQIQQANDGLLFPSSGTSTRGRPLAYWTDGTTIQWYPAPDAVYNMRIWGTISESTSIAAVSQFVYPERAALPIATYAVKLLQIGVGDETGALNALARETFEPVLESMHRNITDRNPGFDYNQYHTE